MKAAKILIPALVATKLVVGGCTRHHGYGSASSYREAALERGLAEMDELVDKTVKDPEKAISARPRSRDRKSTRLNSSHSQISYAVFCLKKKNIILSKPCTWSRS